MSVSYYYIVGDVVIVDGSFSDYTTNLSGGTPHPSVVPGRQLFTYTDIAVTGPAAMDCLVSHVHEQQHHLDLQTTSFGLLAWRVQRCITDDILAILREAQRAGIPFLREGASSRTGLRIVGLDGRPFLDWVTEVAPALKSGRCRIDLDSIVTGLRALLQFRDVLFGGPNVTIGEAVAVGNTALRYLRKRCNLDSTWTFTTGLPEDLLCVRKVQMPWNPTGGKVDGREVLELSAFLAECLFVDLVHGNPQMVTRWRTILGGVDRGWLIPFGDDGLPLQGAKNMFRLAAEYSLSGPGDPALRVDGTINIECVLPQWRLVDALEWLQGDEHSHPETLLVDDPIWDGPVSSHNIYSNLAGMDLNGPRGWGADTLVQGGLVGYLGYMRATDPDVSFLGYRLGEYKRAFEARAADPVGVALPATVDEALFHQPLLEFFDDHVQTNRPVGVNEAYTGYLYESAFIEYVAAETAQSLCELGSRSEQVSSLLLRYEEHTATEFAQEDKEPPDVRDALRAVGLPDWTFEP